MRCLPVFILMIVILTFLVSGNSIAQREEQGGPITTENGVLKTTEIMVGFAHNVIEVGYGVTRVDTSQHPVTDQTVKRHIRELSERYGGMRIRKMFPTRAWGDTLVINRRTGVDSGNCLALYNYSGKFHIKQTR